MAAACAHTCMPSDHDGCAQSHVENSWQLSTSAASPCCACLRASLIACLHASLLPCLLLLPWLVSANIRSGMMASTWTTPAKALANYLQPSHAPQTHLWSCCWVCLWCTGRVHDRLIAMQAPCILGPICMTPGCPHPYPTHLHPSSHYAMHTEPLQPSIDCLGRFLDAPRCLVIPCCLASGGAQAKPLSNLQHQGAHKPPHTPGLPPWPSPLFCKLIVVLLMMAQTFAAI